MNFILHILSVTFLTLITQIGGIIWIINFGAYRLFKQRQTRWIQVGTFIVLYVITSLLVVPSLAKMAGRVPLPVLKSNHLIPHNYITPILNRHYVTPQLKEQLEVIAQSIYQGNNQLKLSYLDANFPFIDGFPLLPHLSHNDGNKIDLAFYYTKQNESGNLKPSNTGYGVFEGPTKREYNQTKACLQQGYKQYDYTKFLTMGSRKDLEFDATHTKKLIHLLVRHPQTEKILIEPHLKNRLQLNHSKIRFQGCRSVRHDDHIHHQIKP